MKRVILLFVCLLFPFLAQAQNVKTYIHPRAEALQPLIETEAFRFAPEVDRPWYFMGLMEHESCVTLKAAKCWNTTSRLKNNREEGLGLGQLTRAWDGRGKLRFDNLSYLRKKYPTHLGEMSWETLHLRPDLQIRSTILLWMEGYRQLQSMEHGLEKMKMVDSIYNGGATHVIKARQICNLTRDCDPNIWYKNVELHLPKSRAPDKRYGGRSMYQINTHHVYDVFENRKPKFKQFWE